MWNEKIDMEKFNNKNKVSFTQSLIEERKKINILRYLGECTGLITKVGMNNEILKGISSMNTKKGNISNLKSIVIALFCIDFS